MMMTETKISSQMTEESTNDDTKQLNDSRNKVTDCENECEESTVYPQLSYQVKKLIFLNQVLTLDETWIIKGTRVSFARQRTQTLQDIYL